ncbi:MAG TPA: EF-hand domain-containing protein [Polyangiaceae bacterium]|nr:EF-hand domain-containing protein [Polyangiaceae bacterium]
MRAALVGCVALVPFGLAGCLPADTRPPPAEVTVTVSSSDLTLNDISSTLTADGFAIEIDRFLVDLGEAQLGDDVDGTCDDYSDPGYTRAFDFKQVTTPQELGIAFATGHCGFGFTIRSPNADTLAGRGLAAGDLDFMRTPGNDPIANNQGISVYVEGRAERGDELERFAWPFRRHIVYAGCDAGTTGDDTDLTLVSGEKTSIDVELRAEGLFQAGPGGPLHFEPFADADTDGDGQITLDELFQVPLATALSSGFFTPMSMPNRTADDGCYDQDGNALVETNLGTYTYCELLPQIAGLQGGDACNDTRSGRPPSN